jgi:hypothetical protein
MAGFLSLLLNFFALVALISAVLASDAELYRSHRSALMSRMVSDEFHLITVQSAYLGPDHHQSISHNSLLFAQSKYNLMQLHDNIAEIDDSSRNRLQPRQFADSMQLTINIPGIDTDFTVELAKNHELLAAGYTETLQRYDPQSHEHLKDRDIIIQGSEIEHCYYLVKHDSADNANKVLGAMHTCRGGFSGHIELNLLSENHPHHQREVYLLEPAYLHLSHQELNFHLESLNSEGNNAAQPVTMEQVHLLYKYSDYIDSKQQHFHPTNSAESSAIPTSCGVKSEEEAHYFSSHATPINSWNPGLMALRNSDGELGLENSRDFRVMASTQKYVELLVVNDHRRYVQHGENTQLSSVAITNTISAKYYATSFDPPLQVFLVSQISFLDADPYPVPLGSCTNCKAGEAGVDQLLNAFNSWRVSNTPNNPHDNGHLFSGIPFEQPVLGYAGVGTMCSPATSGGIENAQNPSDYYNGVISAHEMGHNFGMLHDSVQNACPKSGYIMNAVITGSSAADAPNAFSSCSLNYYNSFLTFHITCLDNKPTHLFSNSSTCGNGFVEQGEQCDCGAADCSQRDPCCNATSCQFMPWATCSSSQGCCNNCTKRAALPAYTCRAASSSCDVDEQCDGASADCPADNYYGAGTECQTDSYGPGLCYAGLCQNILRDCRITGNNFQGAPYGTCSQQNDLNSGDYCSTLWCANDPQQCTYFRTSSQIVLVADGVPCPNSDGDLLNQCYQNQCVDPSVLNPNFYWTAQDKWSYCDNCDAAQARNVSCNSVDTKNQTNINYCSTSNQPAASRKCVNPDIGCYGESGGSSGIDFFGVKTTQNTLLFSFLGGAVGFILLMWGCYFGVTFQSSKELPPLKLNEDQETAFIA